MRGRTDNKVDGNEGNDDYTGAPSVPDVTGPAIPKWSPGAKKVSPPSFLVSGDPAPRKSGADATMHYRRGGMVTRASGGWIKGATSNKGGLHRSLGVPEGDKIPKEKIEKAESSSNPKVKKQAVLAETLSRLRK